MQYARMRWEKYIFQAIRFCIADFLKAEKQESQGGCCWIKLDPWLKVLHFIGFD